MGLGVVKSVETVLLSGVTLTTTTQRTAALNLGTHRRIQVCIAYNAAAIGGIASIIPMGTTKGGDNVNINADDWYAFGVWDGSVTAGTPPSFVATTAMTSTQNFGRCIVYPQSIRTPAALNASDKVRVTFSLDVSGLRQVAFHVAEVGGGAAGTLTISVAPYA